MDKYNLLQKVTDYFLQNKIIIKLVDAEIKSTICDVEIVSYQLEDIFAKLLSCGIRPVVFYECYECLEDDFIINTKDDLGNTVLLDVRSRNEKAKEFSQYIGQVERADFSIAIEDGRKVCAIYVARWKEELEKIVEDTTEKLIEEKRLKDEEEAQLNAQKAQSLIQAIMALVDNSLVRKMKTHREIITYVKENIPGSENIRESKLKELVGILSDRIRVSKERAE